MEASALDTKALTQNKANSESLENKPKEEAKPQNLPKDGHVQINSELKPGRGDCLELRPLMAQGLNNVWPEASNGDISSNKKRKLDVPVRDITKIQSVDDS
ncbi:pre-mRNA cleavage factor Im 25 kDa subunit 1-like [Gossypium australe]|uniref:Pre-mRNA cleavage factor Im 25 kDa subunit 1-like n=1 Tax=Gossypium australe TaxID=47621 RepID=A0A5B6X8S3_9ROSI|nr:pre-mRNA cleavage factor Im 25 kDa subunit 1-like [Gossypium australe]